MVLFDIDCIIVSSYVGNLPTFTRHFNPPPPTHLNFVFKCFICKSIIAVDIEILPRYGTYSRQPGGHSQGGMLVLINRIGRGQLLSLIFTNTPYSDLDVVIVEIAFHPNVLD